MVPVRQVCKWCGKTYSVKERLKGQEISEGNFVDFNSLKKPNEMFSGLKVRKSRKQFMVSSILPKNERKKLTLLLWYLKSSRIVFVLGRIEDTQKTFRN